MLKSFIPLLALSLLASCTPTRSHLKRPDFYTTRKHPGYPNAQYITGIGSGSTEKAAQNHAKSYLGEHISSTLTANSRSVKRSFKKNSKVTFKQTITQAVNIDVQFNRPSLMTIVDTSYDSPSQQYYAFAVLDRTKGGNILYAELEPLIDDFEANYKMADRALSQHDKDAYFQLYPKLVRAAKKYTEALLVYATVVNDLKLYREAGIITKLTTLNNRFTDMSVNTEWLVYIPSAVSGSIKEDKKLTKMVYTMLKDSGLKATLLTHKLDDPKGVIHSGHLKAFSRALGKNKMLLAGEVDPRCSCQQNADIPVEKCGFPVCQLKLTIKGYQLDSQRELFQIIVGETGNWRNKFKDSGISKLKAHNNAAQKLKKFLKNPLNRWTQKYK